VICTGQAYMMAYWINLPSLLCFMRWDSFSAHTLSICNLVVVDQLTSGHGFQQRFVIAQACTSLSIHFTWCKHWAAAAHLSLVLMCLNISALLSVLARRPFGAMQIYSSLLWIIAWLTDGFWRRRRLQALTDRRLGSGLSLIDWIRASLHDWLTASAHLK